MITESIGCVGILLLQMDELDSASLILLLAYTMNSLFWGEIDCHPACPFITDQSLFPQSISPLRE